MPVSRIDVAHVRYAHLHYIYTRPDSFKLKIKSTLGEIRSSKSSSREIKSSLRIKETAVNLLDDWYGDTSYTEISSENAIEAGSRACMV